MPTTIYTLKNPETGEVRYVGKTCKSLSERLSCHKSTAKNNGRRHVCNWIRSMAAVGLSPSISAIEVVPDDGDWASREAFWIRKLRGIGFRLTNHTDGGEGHSGHAPSKETRLKISAAHKGKTISAEQRKAQSLAMTGRKLTESHKLKVGAAMKGRVISDSHRAAMKSARNSSEIYDFSGEKNPRAKITAAQAAEIRLGKHSLSQAKMLFGISKTQFYRIKRGDQWTQT